MDDAIRLNSVSKIYRVPSRIPWKRARKVEALESVSFSCPPQKISCLLGPNGAGKTTIVKILAGLILPDSGEATILGVPLAKMLPSFRSKIGLVTPNERSFYWRLTGRQNLDFYASLFGLSKREKKDRISEVLTELDLEEDADKPFRLYSTGMKQKLLLARALLSRPEVLFLDEPTTHLDPLVQKTMHNIIRTSLIAKRKTTILICTHNLTEAQELSDHLIFLNKGKVLAEGTLPQLRMRMKPHFHLIMEFARLPRNGWEEDLPLEVFRQEKNKLEIKIQRQTLIPQIVEAVRLGGGRLLSCQRQDESLSELFARLMEGEAS